MNDTMNDTVYLEILRVISEARMGLRVNEIEKMLRERGLKLSEKTIRNRLEKLLKDGFLEKDNASWLLTEKGREVLTTKMVFERLGEFSETVEYNLLRSTFNLYTMEGTVPTSFAIIDKDKFEKAMEILALVLNSEVSTTNLVAVFDEGEIADSIVVENGKVALGTISSTIYDIIMLNIGVVLKVEYAGLLKYVGSKPYGLVELINYSGTTISPGLLLVRAGYTSVFNVVKSGDGFVVTAIRSFNPHALEEVRNEVILAESRGIGKVIAITPPMTDIFGIPTGRRAMMMFQAGINQLSPLYELGLDPELKINQALIDFKIFKRVNKLT
ncbi:hypothetical protein DRP07_06060 [Archaeoglobales archaeon]|nr:MAG: hypothetical protein DRP07_06060 [Archaeoglobales archaeon]